MDFLLNVVVVTYLAVAMIMDLKTRCVKNWWIITGFVISIAFSIFAKKGISSFFVGIFFPVPLLLFYKFRMIGAGDIKLLSVLGSILGMGKMIQCIIPILSFSVLLSCLSIISCYYHRKRGEKIDKRIPLVVAIALGVTVNLMGGLLT